MATLTKTPTYDEDVPASNEELFLPSSATKRDMRSKLRQSQETIGQFVNACPFGCADEQLDPLGYCEHLVGFTVPDDKTKYHPQKPIPPLKIGEKTVAVRGVFTDGGETLAVRPGDHLERITTCFRVYREVSAVKPKADKDK